MKLKARRRRAHKELRHQVDLRHLEVQEVHVEEFRNALAEELKDDPIGGVEEV